MANSNDKRKFSNVPATAVGFIWRANTTNGGVTYLSVNVPVGEQGKDQKQVAVSVAVFKSPKWLDDDVIAAINDKEKNVYARFDFNIDAELTIYNDVATINGTLRKISYLSIDGKAVIETKEKSSDKKPAKSGNPFGKTKLGDEVKLSQDDADFEEKKAYLKDNGYTWNSKAKAWKKAK